MNHDQSHFCSEWIADDLGDLAKQGLLRQRRQVKPLADGWCEIDGHRVRDFAGNDYLGLANDKRVITAAQQALDEYGNGPRASTLVTGRTEWHAKLEERLADFENEESAVLFPTGYAANLGTIAALIGPDDVVFCDRFNHASLVDGCRLSRAKLRVFRHNRLERLERDLITSASFRRRLIVTDGAFSMDGDLAPLPELCDLADRFDACILVDEAHGTGVFGENGRGVCEHFGVENRRVIRIGTLSKAVGALGGFVTGTRDLTDWLWNRARTQMFSTALPPAVCAAAIVGIEIIQQEPLRRQRLHILADQMREALNAGGVSILPGNVGPIVPVVTGTAERTMQIAKRLETQGFLVGSIRPPAVPLETSRLRITLSTVHEKSHIDDLANVIVELHSSS